MLRKLQNCDVCISVFFSEEDSAEPRYSECPDAIRLLHHDTTGRSGGQGKDCRVVIEPVNNF